MRRTSRPNRTIIRTPPARTRGSVFALLACVAAGTIPASLASAQASVNPRSISVGGGGGGGAVIIPNDPMLNPDSPEARAYAAVQRERRTAERELRLLKRKHFGSIRDPETREIGILKIRRYTSMPAAMALIDVFDDEQDDVRDAVLDHFSDLEPSVGLPALAWEAVRDKDAEQRARARERLAGLLEERREDQKATDAMPAVRGVIAQGLRSPIDDRAIAATDLAASLRLFDFIPLMAAAQVAQRATGPQGQGGGDLGWIMIGRQQTYVADLQPVVSNNAVAFDPQIGVVSDGVLLRVHDAVVTAVRTPIHRRLVAMTSDAWGRPTDHLGFDADAWRDWYDNEFVPGREPTPDLDAEPSPPPSDD